MGILFNSFKEQNYFLSKWSGKITDREMLDEYARFFSSEDWVPGMNELSDVAEVDMTDISPTGVLDLKVYTEKTYSEHNVDKMKTAIYCSDALPYGIATVYQSLAEDSPEDVRVFLDFDEAKEWLL
ncbi:hypothetical protein [Desulfopila aestuarii]|uniref:SpoIIAA-like n=1 Tax=Desulfopila aestuarii DSM 18488 TaxID=1121416 RepID=A0A1M7YLH9_9BACT|nr:hypothetical protein [Desulfopila aestuarii]SHO53485.1 hypothetical protein SAMN02745220_05151 [Desulfopila aestuarii DSM 18488]